MATLTRRLDEVLFDAWSAHMGRVMQEVGLEVPACAAERSDDDPPEQMRALGGNLEQLGAVQWAAAIAVAAAAGH